MVIYSPCCAHTKEKGAFSKEKNLICDCSRSNQIPLADQITDIVPYVRIYIFDLPSILVPCSSI